MKIVWVFALLLAAFLLVVPEAAASGNGGRKVGGSWRAYPCDRVAHPECASWMPFDKALSVAASMIFNESKIEDRYVEEKRSFVHETLFFLPPHRIYVVKVRKCPGGRCM